MKTFIQWTLLVCGISLGINIFAEKKATANIGDTIELEGRNARTTPSFNGRSNIRGLLPSNMEGIILSEKKLPSGAKAILVKLTSSKGSFKKGSRFWIYDPRTTQAGTCTHCGTRGSSRNTNISDLGTVAASISSVSSSRGSGKWDDIPWIKDYEESSEVQKMLTYALRNFGHVRRSQRACYAKVKNSMLAGDVVSYRPPGGFAREAVQDLKKQCMVNLMDEYGSRIRGPADAPKGSILVYNSCRQRGFKGHTEIKTDHGAHGGYISDYYSAKSVVQNNVQRSSKCYTLKGVMVHRNIGGGCR